jgi:hypothetical protein
MSVPVRREIVHLLVEGHTNAAEMYRHCQGLGLLGENPVSDRTFARWVKRIKPGISVKDPSGPWRFAEADPEEAALLLDVLLAVEERTKGVLTLTAALAEWVVRLRTASPGMPPWIAFAFASAYRRRSVAQEESRDLDLLLAARTWERPIDPGTLKRLHTDGWKVQLARDGATDFLWWHLEHARAERDRLGTGTE